jgi:putative membrane protein
MSVRSHMPYLSAFVLFCGVALAQNPPGSAPSNPQPGTPPTAGANPSAYPDARTGSTDTMPGTDTMVMSDKAFIKKAAEDNITETQLGKLAQEKGSSEAVKQFGKRMVDDHTKASQQLSAVAPKMDVEVPTELAHGGKKTYDKLAKLSGPDFDRAYAKQMLNAHKEDVDAFQREAQLGKVPEVRTFAAKTLPVIQEHRKMAEEMQNGISRK